MFKAASRWVARAIIVKKAYDWWQERKAKKETKRNYYE